VIGQLELPTRLVKLRLSGGKIGFRLIERGLRGNTPFQKLLLALEVSFGVLDLCFDLLDAGACLVDLALQ